LCVPFVDKPGDRGCGVGAHAVQNVAVPVQRERRARVAESAAHDLDVNAGGDQMRRVAMAQIMEPDVFKKRKAKKALYAQRRAAIQAEPSSKHGSRRIR
jgi:hypothetical protein